MATNLARFGKVGKISNNLFHFAVRPLLSRQHAVKQTSASFLSTDNASPSLLSIDKHDGFGVITMNSKPVNALSSEMFTQLCDAVDELESDKSCQGLILASALPKIFTAGLNIPEFLQERESLSKFWFLFQEIWLKLYGSRLASIAAINGAAPAGGCLLALSCDYRIMKNGAVIGPNETRLGMVAPPWFQDSLVNTVGQRHAEHLLALGQLVSSERAFEIGLVDCVVESDVVEAAASELKKWLEISGVARSRTKQMLRHSTLEKLRQGRDADVELFLDYCTKDSTQKMLAGYLKSLGKK